MMAWIRFAACGLVLLSGLGFPPKSQASETAPAPAVVPADSLEPADVSESAVLAHRILARESEELLLDAKRRRELAREIEGVFDRLRYAHPEMAKVSARASHAPGALLLGVKPGLFKAVAGLLEGASGPAPLRTGNPAFDALNVKLELRAVRPYRHTGVLLMRLSEHLNVRTAQKAYVAIEGVEYAEPDARLGDGPDIEAAKSGGAWHVVVRKARGDCPAGCIYKKLFFFTVAGGEVERIEPSDAMKMSGFRKILTIRNWR